MQMRTEGPEKILYSCSVWAVILLNREEYRVNHHKVDKNILRGVIDPY